MKLFVFGVEWYSKMLFNIEYAKIDCKSFIIFFLNETCSKRFSSWTVSSTNSLSSQANRILLLLGCPGSSFPSWGFGRPRLRRRTIGEVSNSRLPRRLLAVRRGRPSKTICRVSRPWQIGRKMANPPEFLVLIYWRMRWFFGCCCNRYCPTQWVFGFRWNNRWQWVFGWCWWIFQWCWWFYGRCWWIFEGCCNRLLRWIGRFRRSQTRSGQRNNPVPRVWTPPKFSPRGCWDPSIPCIPVVCRPAHNDLKRIWQLLSWEKRIESFSN